MLDRTFWFFGGPCDIGSVVRHYRAMAHREPAKAAFWRTLLRSAIAEFRAQASSKLARAA